MYFGIDVDGMEAISDGFHDGELICLPSILGFRVR
jgi:hypothetical protein